MTYWPRRSRRWLGWRMLHLACRIGGMTYQYDSSAVARFLTHPNGEDGIRPLGAVTDTCRKDTT